MFFKNPLTAFVYGIISKWYLMIAVSGLVVVFWVFKGLDKAGVIKESEKVIFKALNDSKSVAKNCVPKILDLNSFWQCVENPPSYEPDAHDKQLEEAAKSLFAPMNSSAKNPYEE